MKNIPYPYQSILLEKIETHIQQDIFPVVLAASCGSGKTFMSIYYIEGYLKRNPTAKVLVLAHGQTILRSQYHDNLKDQDPAFKYVEITKGNQLGKYYLKKQVFVTLPQTLQKIQVPHFDLIVVDEAHQRYFAKQVEDIIKQAKLFHQLLLTGTPSPFIARNTPTKKEFNILTLPMSRLLEEGAITDVLVELASTTYPISGEDYNQEGNLKGTFKFEDLDTTTTLDTLLDKIHKRLKSVVKNNPTIYAAVPTLSDWVSVLNCLDKTMVACHSQEQARQVAKYFTDKGINTALSTSDDDLEAEEVDRFVNDKDCAVLIVVCRGLLGFNYEELVNVVDLTGTQNINRIFQLMARVVRKHPKGYKKLFFKVVPKTMASYFEHLMTGVLCLTCEEWYTKYNGHNFLQLPLPIRKNNKVSGPRKGGGNKSPKQKPKPVEYVGLPAIQLFNDITHKDNSEFNSYEWTTLGKVREKLLDVQNRNPEDHKHSIIRFIEQFKNRPHRNSFNIFENMSEDKLEKLMRSYISPNGSAFDPLFKEHVDKLCPTTKNISFNKQLIVNFIKNNGRKPSKSSSDKNEYLLGNRMQGYVSPASKKFDKEFRDLIEFLSPFRNNETEVIIKKESILEFIKINNRIPSQHSTSKEEKKLGMCISQYMSKKSECFDGEFRNKVLELTSIRKVSPSEKKKDFLNFLKKFHRRPSDHSENREEANLMQRARAYMKIGDKSYDPKFKKNVEDLSKELGI